MANYQVIYNKANKDHDDSPEWKSKINDAFDAQNQTYGYFTTEKEKSDALQEFTRYFKFLSRVKNDEDKDVAEEELYSRAYHATVLLGGGAPESACATLDKLIQERYKHATNPVHDVFATLKLPIKASDLNLSLWREWINGPQTKKALDLFASASDIANKFGPLHKGWQLTLTKSFPKEKNTLTDKLYVHEHQDRKKLGYAFMAPVIASPHPSLRAKRSNPEGSAPTPWIASLRSQRRGSGEIMAEAAFFDEARQFISGTINKADLDPQSLTLLELHWNDPTWRSGERATKDIKLSEQDKIFSVIGAASQQSLSHTLTLSDVEILEGRLTYERFNEAPELAQLCRLYKKPESIFNQCLQLLSQQKTFDTLPDVSINGNDVGYPGYHLLKLPINDPRALLLGDITNCCQSIGGHSQQCVMDGWRLKDRGFYVLVKEKKVASNPSTVDLLDPKHSDIIGQGYTWRSALGNLVFDSWENLRPEADNGIAVKMLSEFGKRVVADRTHGVFRVTIGTGGKTPLELTTHERITAEVVAKGYQYGDSYQQVDLASVPFNDKEWLDSIDAALLNSSLSEQEKTVLKQCAPMAAQYPDMLKTYLSKGLFHHWISAAIAQNNLALSGLLNGLMSLYVSVKDNTANVMAIMALLMNNRDDSKPQMMTETRDFAFPRNFQLLLSLALKLTNEDSNVCAPALLINSLKEALCNLSFSERSALLSDYQRNKALGIIHTIYRYPALLSASFMFLPGAERLLAAKEKDNVLDTVLYKAASNPESVNAILALYPEAERLLALKEKNSLGETVLHFVVSNPESLKAILTLLPEADRHLAVKEKDTHGETVLHNAVSNPESVKAILTLLPVPDRISAVNEKDKYGRTVLDKARFSRESLNAILALLPKVDLSTTNRFRDEVSNLQKTDEEPPSDKIPK